MSAGSGSPCSRGIRGRSRRRNRHFLDAVNDVARNGGRSATFPNGLPSAQASVGRVDGEAPRGTRRVRLPGPARPDAGHVANAAEAVLSPTVDRSPKPSDDRAERNRAVPLAARDIAEARASMASHAGMASQPARGRRLQARSDDTFGEARCRCLARPPLAWHPRLTQPANPSRRRDADGRLAWDSPRCRHVWNRSELRLPWCSRGLQPGSACVPGHGHPGARWRRRVVGRERRSAPGAPTSRHHRPGSWRRAADDA